ncbi:MAG TPA: sulfide/dihydroorotate dehydrogenase-like FAD/NAD-binding protein [Candidatus Omnitrophica bacterium]|nr:MAG: hypothetical protein A2Z81_04085 [Omnitrophica WOR_2 bacterium GWA2_45_18]HBR14806.1 sulfide/dihydroorotate dehydrogenase-like FAD/NAD-binding protein [Candidatus Omnitrophota bacterium]
MSFKVVNKLILAKDIKRLDILAPNIARKFQPGHYVSVCPEEGDERVPLSVIDADPVKGTISLIFLEEGQTTTKLGTVAIGESVFSVLGPLGVPARIEKTGTVVCIATGIWTAQILPICRGYRKTGNKVIGIIGAKTKKTLMLEAQMRLSCNTIYMTTNDGSYERRGLATDVLREFISKNEVNLVYAIGSADMMQAVCGLTRDKNIPTRVQLSPVMVDCMGMCGSCRVKVGGKTVLACIDGPEFDGHKVDFEDFHIRIKSFEELDEWRSRKSQLNPKKNESKTLTKFLSDFLKN